MQRTWTRVSAETAGRRHPAGDSQSLTGRLRHRESPGSGTPRVWASSVRCACPAAFSLIVGCSLDDDQSGSTDCPASRSGSVPMRQAYATDGIHQSWLARSSRWWWFVPCLAYATLTGHVQGSRRLPRLFSNTELIQLLLKDARRRVRLLARLPETSACRVTLSTDVRFRPLAVVRSLQVRVAQ